MISQPTATGPLSFAFKSPRQPMLWAACVYSAGILTGAYAWRPPVWWMVGAIALMAAGAYFALRRSGLAWLLGLSTLFFLGASTFNCAAPYRGSIRPSCPTQIIARFR